MRAGLLFAAGVWALGLLGTCNTPAPPPSPGPPPTPTPTAPTSVAPAAIYAELVEAGYYAPSDAGVFFVTQETQLTPPPAWMRCLIDGGTIASCAPLFAKDAGGFR